MNVAICDDDNIFLRILKQQISEITYVEAVDVFSEIGAFFQAMKHTHFDMVIMDFDWNTSETGIDYAEKIGSLDANIEILYVSSYVDKYIEQLFMGKTNVSGILNKPIKQDRLLEHMDYIYSKISNVAHISISEKGQQISIAYHHMKYIESNGHYIDIHTRKEIFHTQMSLSDIEELLPDEFVRCHKGFIVHMDYVEKFSAKMILLEGGDEIPIGRKYSKNFKESFYQYMKKRCLEL